MKIKLYLCARNISFYAGQNHHRGPQVYSSHGLVVEADKYLIGSNGVGKSNFISFFRLVNNIYEQRLQNYTMQNRAESLLHYGIKHTKLITGCLQFSAYAYSFTLQPRDNGSMSLS